jgi:hypothetical protein
MSEATQVLEDIKSLTAEEPPVLNVQAIAEAATRKVVEALSAQLHAELERLPDADAVTAVMEKPTTVSAPETPVMPQFVLLPAESILLAPEVVSVLRASVQANLPEVTAKILRVVLK